MTTLQNRYRGTLLGLLAGDVLGAPYETWSQIDIQADFMRRGGLTFFNYPDPWDTDGVFPAGRPTDDSEMTAALATVLANANGYTQGAEYGYFKSVAAGVSMLWGGPAKGFGGTTKKALCHATLSESFEDASIPPIPTNGSLMRTSPMALAFRNAPLQLVENTLFSSSITHRNPLCGAVCVYYAQVLVNILNGMNPKEAIAAVTDMPPALQDTIGFSTGMIFERPNIPPKFPNRGDVLLSLHAALWSFVTATSFEDGITKAISLGGDTDTYAAIAGALLGAYWGKDAIPTAWLAQLKGREVMTTLADRLYSVSECSPKG